MKTEKLNPTERFWDIHQSSFLSTKDNILGAWQCCHYNSTSDYNAQLKYVMSRRSMRRRGKLTKKLTNRCIQGNQHSKISLQIQFSFQRKGNIREKNSRIHKKVGNLLQVEYWAGINNKRQSNKRAYAKWNIMWKKMPFRRVRWNKLMYNHITMSRKMCGKREMPFGKESTGVKWNR